MDDPASSAGLPVPAGAFSKEAGQQDNLDHAPTFLYAAIFLFLLIRSDVGWVGF